MTTKPTVFVAGSAHLDILGKSRIPDQVLDRIGDISIEVGGTACNIAVNLARMGVHVRFASAMNKSAYTDIVAAFLKENGVETDIVCNEALPVAAFCAHIDHTGEMISAVTSAPVEHHPFTEEFFLERMRGAEGAIIDCNLSAAAVDAAVYAANELDIPVFVAAVSEPKSLRLAGIGGRVSAAFLNRNEIKYLKDKSLPTAVDYEDMSNLLDMTIVVTLGEHGAMIVNDRESVSVNPPAIANPENMLGMGDMFLSATVKYHLVNGQTLHQAARNAVIFTRELAKRRNCNLGSPHVVEKVIASMRHEADTDALTGINNRRSSEAILEDALRTAAQTEQPLSVILVDIDHFKRINDTLGHDAGDQVLSEVADVIYRSVRETDAVGRWGGEEFIAVLPGLSLGEAYQMADRIRKAVSDEPRAGMTVTISAGVAASRSGEPFKEIVMRADLALYQAKHDGRNRVCSEDETREAALKSGNSAA